MIIRALDIDDPTEKLAAIEKSREFQKYLKNAKRGYYSASAELKKELETEEEGYKEVSTLINIVPTEGDFEEPVVALTFKTKNSKAQVLIQADEFIKNHDAYITKTTDEDGNDIDGGIIFTSFQDGDGLKKDQYELLEKLSKAIKPLVLQKLRGK